MINTPVIFQKENDYRLVSKMFNITLNKMIYLCLGGNSNDPWIKQKADYNSFIAISLTKEKESSFSPRRIKIKNEKFYLKKSWLHI